MTGRSGSPAADARARRATSRTAEVITNPEALARMLALENAKYHTDYAIELLDPAVNATIRVQPRWVFGLAEGDFTGSPTRWVFEPE